MLKENYPYPLNELIQTRPDHTISKGLGKGIVLFSLAEGTDISVETYIEDHLYLVLQGEISVQETKVHEGQYFRQPKETPTGIRALGNAIYIEVALEDDLVSNSTSPKNLMTEGSIATSPQVGVSRADNPLPAVIYNLEGEGSINQAPFTPGQLTLASQEAKIEGNFLRLFILRQ